MRALTWLCGLAILLTSPAVADDHEFPTPRAVVERAVEAHGGDLWLEPGTL